MTGARLKALAKINLALHVGPLRQDGYHPVETLCVFMPAGDGLEVSSPASDFALEITGPEGRGLKASPGNLVLRAAELLARETDVPPCRLRLEKQVPVASGIGGGTSNGAATLYLLNSSSPAPLPPARLMDLSRRLGADGPVCLAPYLFRAESFRAQGIGHEISPGPSLPPVWMCLANPRRAVPTGEVFRRFDNAPAPVPFSLSRPSRLSDYDSVAAFMTWSRNDLAPAAETLCPEITALVTRMAGRPGCLAARMSGSGATVFGLFTSAAAARRAARACVAEGNWAVSGRLHRGGEAAW